MSKQKLAAGCLRLRVKLEAEVVGVGWTEMIMSGGTQWAIGRVANGKWWLWEDAPAECFEGGEPMRPLGDGEFVAEVECPSLEVGQWVEFMDGLKLRGIVVRVDGQRVIVRNPYGPAEASQKYPHWVQPVDSVIPCSPACTEAQLAIRVGDEVRVAHDWEIHGEPRQTSFGISDEVFVVKAIYDTSGAPLINLRGQKEKTHWSWNLEPVKPRA